jgi:hypothetical protein
MVFYATFNNISAISRWSVLFMEETGVPEENHRLVATHLQTLSYDVVSSAPRHAKSEIRTRNVIGDRSRPRPPFCKNKINTGSVVYRLWVL